MTTTHAGRKSGKTTVQLEKLASIAHPDDYGQLKVDLATWGSCYVDGDGRRIPPTQAPPVRSTRPLTEATPAALPDVGGCSGWYLADRPWEDRP